MENMIHRALNDNKYKERISFEVFDCLDNKAKRFITCCNITDFPATIITNEDETLVLDTITGTITVDSLEDILDNVLCL